jgi:hypothetical protein
LRKATAFQDLGNNIVFMLILFSLKLWTWDDPTHNALNLILPHNLCTIWTLVSISQCDLKVNPGNPVSLMDTAWEVTVKDVQRVDRKVTSITKNCAFFFSPLQDRISSHHFDSSVW